MTALRRLLVRADGLRWIPALTLGVLAYAVVLQITDPPGPGLDPDAVAYLGGAESLVASGEYRTPTAPWWSADSTQLLSHFPPGVSTAIAIPTALGMAPTQAARLVNALAAFVTMTTLVLLVIDASTALTGTFVGVAIFAMSSMLEVHVSVLSEPLFLAFTVLLLAAMVRRPSSPLSSGAVAALGMIVRYAGASLVAAAALWSAARGPQALRVRRAIVAILPALVLQGAWVLRTRSVKPGEPIRELSYYGHLRPTFAEGWRTMEAWLVPDADAWNDPMRHRGVLTLVALAIAAAIVAAGVRGMRTHRATSAGRALDRRLERALELMRTGALLVVCYVAVVFGSRVLADPQIPFDQRILSPALLLMTALVGVCASSWWRSSTTVLPKIACAAALTVWWLAAARVTWRQQRQVHELGSDFDRARWSGSELITYAAEEAATHPLYSNWPAAVYFHLHRSAHDVPELGDSDRMEEFADTVGSHDGRVLMFRLAGVTNVTLDSLRRVRGLRIVLEGPSGAVFAPAQGEVTPAPPMTVAPSSPRR
jgi:hypothetical protein